MSKNYARTIIWILTNRLLQISDLLNEISGGKTSSSPFAPKPAVSIGVKRKAADGSDDSRNKLPKFSHPDKSSSASKITRDDGRASERPQPVTNTPNGATVRNEVAPRTTSKPPSRTSSPAINGRPNASATNGQRASVSSNGGHHLPNSSSMRSAEKASLSSTSPAQFPSTTSLAKLKPRPTTTGDSAASPAKFSATAANPTDLSKAPKKGSFAEIMARAQKAQESMGKVGVIQHKAIEKPLSKREARIAEQKRAAQEAAERQPQGTGRLGHGPQDAPQKRAGKDAAPSANRSRAMSSGGDTPAKKVRKSAMASTGYTGTARPSAPPAKAPVSARNGKPAPAQGRTAGGGLLAPPKYTRRDKYEDEYDDEMDDFIDYDEEEDEIPGQRRPSGLDSGRRGGYDSDEGSSDMEAGMSDLDVEERRAEKLAKQEDRKEEELEKKLKREKEERRKRFATGR